MDTEPHITGKVYLVGAGPSDPELLTLKGYRVLQQAQVVIYDALIGPGIYSMIPQSAEKIAVGKRAGRHTRKQDEINRLILAQAQAGRCVVRLKGGDPFLFGRGAEELELLCAHQIPYEIVPGVTSAAAAPAYAGIPLTCREGASSVHILTGHRKQDEPLEIDFQALVQAGGTSVFLMGMSAIHEIVMGFLQAGMPPDTPAAVIAQGTGARQRSVTASLCLLEEEVVRQQIKAPAVIVIGQTAAYGKRFAWRENLPLSKSRILVTRPASRSGRFAKLLRELGAEVLEIPSICTQVRDCAQQLREVLAQIHTYQYLVFTSPAGVEYFMEILDQLEWDIRCIGDVKLAVIGPGTRDALKKYGLRAACMPEHYNSTALGRLLRQSMPDGGRVLLLRSALGSRELIQEIQNGHQIKVTELAIYDTVYEIAEQSDKTQEICSIQGICSAQGAGDLYLKALLEHGQIDMVMFTSASTVRGFVQMTPGVDDTKICAVCIGQMTADQAMVYGMQVHQAAEETLESMVDTAVMLAQQKYRKEKDRKK